jgi:hypothetical protein
MVARRAFAENSVIVDHDADCGTLADDPFAGFSLMPRNWISIAHSKGNAVGL